MPPPLLPLLVISPELTIRTVVAPTISTLPSPTILEVALPDGVIFKFTLALPVPARVVVVTLPAVILPLVLMGLLANAARLAATLALPYVPTTLVNPDPLPVNTLPVILPLVLMGLLANAARLAATLALPYPPTMLPAGMLVSPAALPKNTRPVILPAALIA